MAARQIQILAGSASAVAAVMLGLAGCAAAAHPTADSVPRPASQTAAAAGHTSPRTAGTAVRLASPLMKCADQLGDGGAVPAAGGATLRQVGVIHFSHLGLVMLCVPVNDHCPRGFRIVYPKEFSGHQMPVRLPYRVVCITRFPLRPLPPEPQLTPMPAHTMPLGTLPPHTMPAQAAG